MDNKANNEFNRSGWWIVALLALLIISAFGVGAQRPATQSGKKATIQRINADKSPIRPTIPNANRYQAGRVFLEHADSLFLRDGKDYQVLTGSVELRKGDMWMYCDSAYFFDKTNSLQAFGNVRMQQGDTLFVYADMLDYDGPMQIATLVADDDKQVRLINRDVMLRTDVFYYDLSIDLGYYNTHGILTDKKNRLESMEGEYSPTTKDANFYTNVHLTSRSNKDTLNIYTDTLLYNTYSHIAQIICPTTIENADGKIYTDRGTYNTEIGLADLYDRSRVVTSNNKTLEGDTLMYDRKRGYGEAFGNMVLTDPDRHVTLKGDYGYYNELRDSALVTGNALATEYSRPDTLFIHGDTIRGFQVITPAVDTIPADTTHYIVSTPHVRFWRVDIQGLCDSLTLIQRDSMMYLDIHPVLWSGARQIFGGQIAVHFNDSTADWAHLPDFGFMAELIEEPYYNQLSGKEMKAFFEDQDLKHLDVSGNVQAIFLPQESDSTYNKIANVESSFLAADFLKRDIERMKMWPETSGTVTPLYMAKRSLFYLPQFKWWESLRPTGPDDVFNRPQEMDTLLSEPDPGRRRTAK